MGNRRWKDRWETRLSYLDSEQPLLSVIIPTLNEAETIQASLQSVIASGVEVIVVDGGSHDRTVELATAMGVTVIQAERGRAGQMNLGAKQANGSVLLFLHADTHLPDRFVTLIQTTLAQPNTIAGAFKLTISGEAAGLRWIERLVNWRSRWLQLPYGDQALFLAADTFWKLGGFAAMPIMEDFEFVRRLQRLGRIRLAPAAVITSGRRWQKLGLWQTTGLNQMIVIAYFLGVSPDRLARWYRRQQ